LSPPPESTDFGRVQKNARESPDDASEGRDKPIPAPPPELPLADRIRETAVRLRELFEKSRVFLANEYSDEAEIAAQQRLREVIESADTEKDARATRRSQLLALAQELQARMAAINSHLQTTSETATAITALFT
jgi:hypothetical protein